MTTSTAPLARVLAQLDGVRQSGDGYAARCPAHDDTTASLSVGTGDDGRVLATCHAGCDLTEIVAAIGLTVRDLHVDGGRRTRTPPPRTTVHVIRDTTGRPVAEHMREDRPGVPKRMYWRRPGATRPGLGGIPTRDLPLYGSERLRDLADGATVVVTEGERAADALLARSIAAVGTVTGAAATPSDDVLRVLLGHDVVLWPDADDPGAAHMTRIAARLVALGVTPRWLTVDGAADGDDAADVTVDNDTVRDWIANALVWAPTDSDADAWGPLVPLDHAHTLPALPLDAFSPWLREITSALTCAYQVPPELPGMYALALVSGAMAGRYVVVVRPGWRMPPVLYVVVALPPSERKSPVIHRLAEPLRAWEREQAIIIGDARRRALVAVEQARARAEAALRALTRPSKDADDNALAEAHRAAAQTLAEAEAAVPAEARLIVEYATPEALAERMADRGDRQIIMSDEGAGVFAMTGRYAKWGGADLDLLLKGYDGESYTPDRVTRKVRPMTAATLTIALGVQPAALGALLRQAPEIRERGLLARMLVSLPTPRVGTRQIRPAPVPPAIGADYDRQMRALLDVPDVYRDGLLTPRELWLSPEADNVIAAFEARLEPELGRGGRYERIAAAAGKLAGTAARLAAVLHAADHAGGEIPPEVPATTAARAVRLAEACIPHLEALEDALSAPPELDGARRTADWLGRYGQPVVSDRDILRGIRGTAVLATAEQRDAALRLLERHGYIRRAASPTPRTGRPSPGWEVRPDWLSSWRGDSPPHGQNGQNTRSEPDGGAFVHFVHGYATPATDDPEVLA